MPAMARKLAAAQENLLNAYRCTFNTEDGQADPPAGKFAA